MTKISLTCAVFLGSCLLYPGTFAHAADTPLYDRFLDLTRRELRLNARGQLSPERHAKEGVDESLPNRIKREASLEQIDDLLNGGTALCDQEEWNTTSECPQDRSEAHRLTRRNQELLSLSRDLLLITSSNEQRILGGFGLPFTSRLQGIARMWRADIVTPEGNDEDDDDSSIVGAGSLRIRSDEVPDSDSLIDAFTALSQSLDRLIVRPVPQEEEEDAEIPEEAEEDLTGIDSTELAAAVWRYRFGVRWIRRELTQYLPPSDAFLAPAPRTERELLQKRWEDTIERYLVNIEQILAQQEEEIGITRGEVVLFEFPTSLNDLLPDNVRVWAYLERLADGTLTGDAGLQWQHALEPAPLTLCSENSDGTCAAIPGGHYPPPPEEHLPDEFTEQEYVSPVCMYPLMRGGLLCSPPREESQSVCAEQVAEDADTIQLAACTARQASRETEFGGDVCSDPSWKLNAPKQFDPNTQCKVEFRCGVHNFNAVTSKKNDRGVITVTMQDTPRGGAKFTLRHEMVHVKQACHLGVDADPYVNANSQQDLVDLCCRLESDAYRVQCEAMEEDGVFTNQTVAWDGRTPMNRETCVQAYTDASCRLREIVAKGGPLPDDHGACPWSFTYKKTYQEVRALEENLLSVTDTWVRGYNTTADAEGRPRLPVTCQQATEPVAPMRMDPGLVAAVTALKSSGPDVCTPGQQTAFHNTAGNTVCYLNRCWKQSFEDHRLIPGRATLTEGESAFPFDVCMRENREIARIVPSASTTSQWIAPPYRPREILREMEETLCPGQPFASATCSFDPSRRLNFPLAEGVKMTEDIVQQEQEYQQPGIALRQLSEAIGLRIGGRLWNDLLERKIGGLTDFTKTAAALLTQFTRAKFPTVMCPLNDTDGQGLLGTPLCGPTLPPDEQAQ